MLRLHADLGVDLVGAAIIVDLLERLERLKRSWLAARRSLRPPTPSSKESGMDPNRLTEKAQDAIRQAQSLAQRQGQSQIDVEHLAVALLVQDGGVAPRMVEKAGATPASLVQRLQQALERLPRVSGPGAPAGPGLHLAARERGPATAPRPRPSA